MVKIDLEKTFERLEWSFIFRTLTYFNFPPKIKKLIMACISTSQIVVLVNGSKTEFFKPSRGIRQGYHMSPYIFILFMELLSLYINHQFDITLWYQIKLNHRCPPLSYLFLADDFILMANANEKSVCMIQHCLSSFCHYSGQNINLAK